MNWPEFFKRRLADRQPPKPPNLSIEMRLGAEASALMDSPAFQRVMERMRVQIIESWAASPLEDKEGQHELRLMLKVLDGMEQQIKDESDSGKMAKRQLEDEQRRKAA